MKKQIQTSVGKVILLLFVLLLCDGGSGGRAEEIQSSPDTLRFVYIHGTNQNSPQSRRIFNDRVAKLHPCIKAALEKEPLVQAHLLEQGRMKISTQTINFFWGNLSHIAVESLRRSVYAKDLMQGWLHLAERAREKLSFTLHDAVWLEKESRKKEVLHDLFQMVVQQNQQPIVLMGHSAGSLVAYDLLLYRLPYLEVRDFAREIQVEPQVLANAQAHNDSSYTCLEALLSSSAIRYDAQGKLVPFFKGLEPQMPSSALESFRTHWIAALPDYTHQYCLPEGMVRGMVTFGSPLALFDSAAAEPKRDDSYLTASMARYMLAHNIAWLHVNRANDYIALPLPDRQRFIDFIIRRTGSPPVLNGGFTISYLYRGGGATLLNAHGWYWNKPKAFARTVGKAYRDGYRDWYPSARSFRISFGKNQTK